MIVQICEKVLIKLYHQHQAIDYNKIEVTPYRQRPKFYTQFLNVIVNYIGDNMTLCLTTRGSLKDCDITHKETHVDNLAAVSWPRDKVINLSSPVATSNLKHPYLSPSWRACTAHCVFHPRRRQLWKQNIYTRCTR